MHSGEHMHLHLQLRHLLQLSTRHSFGCGHSMELLGSTDMPCLDDWRCSYSLVHAQCELLLLEWV